MTADAVDLSTVICSVNAGLCGGNITFLTHLLIHRRVTQGE